MVQRVEGVDPARPYAGRIVSGPGDTAGQRGRLQVRPAKNGRVRVRVWTEEGTLLVDGHARDGEITTIEAPARDGSQRTEKFPGSFWFYLEAPTFGGDSVDLGFMPDHHAGALALPMAIESEPRGRVAT